MFLSKVWVIQITVLMLFSLFQIAIAPTVFCSPETITLTGQWTYHDNNDVPRPLVWARLLICDREPDGRDYLLYDIFGNPGDIYTNINGNFAFGPIDNNDGPGEDGLDIVIYAFTINWAAQVIDADGYTYGVYAGPRWNLSDGPHTINVQIPQGQGAWMIFSYHCGIAAGWNYLDTTTGYEAPMVICRWPYETWPHYHHGGEIHLPDWACWWPDVILHEYSHYVMYTLYGYMPTPPGGPPPEHYINETSNNVTAWVEGWANFFPLVVQNDPDLLGWNLETPHWCSPNWDDGDEVEGRVAGALWDIFDSQNDSAPWYYDSLSDGFTHIWNIMHTTPCDTFHEFWQAWNTSGYLEQSALMAIFQNAIDYRGPGDVDGDCIVELTDFYVLSAAFGSTKGSPRWDQRADLNFDGIVDMMDFSIASQNFGKDYDC